MCFAAVRELAPSLAAEAVGLDPSPAAGAVGQAPSPAAGAVGLAPSLAAGAVGLALPGPGLQARLTKEEKSQCMSSPTQGTLIHLKCPPLDI